jgi:mRNA interferase HigB
MGPMHVVTKKRLTEFAAMHAGAAIPLDVWYRVAKAAEWKSLVDVKDAYPQADYVAPYTVFNIKGNTYRLITKIEYRFQKIFIKHVLTHADYNKDEWK